MTRANPHHPYLGLRTTGFETSTGRYFASINFKISGFDVDRHDSALIVGLNLRAHLRFIDLISPSRKFFFTGVGLPNCHGFNPVSTLNCFYFTLQN
jgi:hypothetical protein